MKAWRLTEHMKPQSDDLVLGSMKSGDYEICYYDGEDWWTATDIHISDPLYWMPIPILPNE